MSDIKRASLEDINRMHELGEVRPPKKHAAVAPESVLPDDFWDNAVVMQPEDWAKRSVHLKLDPEVFEYFKSGGKGHLTRMQNVLKAYVKAQTR